MSPSGDDRRLADGDDLVRRYHEASASASARPSADVRDAVRAHALAMIAAHTAQATPSPTVTSPAANASRWKLSLLASLALAGLTGLVVLQLDRGTADEKDVAMGQAESRNQAERPKSPAAEAGPTSAETVGADASAADTTTATAAARLSAPAQKSIARPAPSTAMSRPMPPPPAAPTPPPPAYPAELDAAMAAIERTAEPAASSPSPSPAAAPPQAFALPDTAGVIASPVAPSGLARSATPAEQRRANEAARPPGRRSLTSTLPLASALQEAARNGHASRLDRLLVRGAPLNAADTAGRTPLMLAVIHNHPAMVQRLLAAGANVSLIDRDGITALQHAQRLKRERIVRLIEESS